jgi:4-carboxymuconolactone decarboxylase
MSSTEGAGPDPAPKERVDRAARGEAVRREVLGDAHVDTALARRSELTQRFQDYLTGAAWADVWGDDTLDRPTRSLVTIAILAALGRQDELELHLRAAHRTGADPARIAETLLHVAVYAGVPAANAAFAALQRSHGTSHG